LNTGELESVNFKWLRADRIELVNISAAIGGLVEGSPSVYGGGEALLESLVPSPAFKFGN
jgi:hypothetical protein